MLDIWLQKQQFLAGEQGSLLPDVVRGNPCLYQSNERYFASYPSKVQLERRTIGSYHRIVVDESSVAVADLFVAICSSCPCTCFCLPDELLARALSKPAWNHVHDIPGILN